MKTLASVALSALLLSPLAAAAELRIPEEALRGQNAQYQQGFRDGFREAVRMMQGGGSTGSGFGSSRGIRIEQALYGSDQRRCDFTRELARQADGQREFRFRAGNGLCGDPHRGKDKQALVRYSCDGRNPRQVSVREDQSARLRCD